MQQNRDWSLQEQMNGWADHARQAASLLRFAIEAIESGDTIQENFHLADEAIRLAEPLIGKIRTGLQHNGAITPFGLDIPKAHAQVLQWRAEKAAHRTALASYPDAEQDALEEADYSYTRVIRMAADYRKQLLKQRGNDEEDEELNTLLQFARQAEARLYYEDNSDKHPSISQEGKI